MRGVDSVNISHMVDFIYHGKVKIEQDLLQSFLALAQELGVKGLTNDISCTPESVPNPENSGKNGHCGKGDTFEKENPFGGRIEKMIARGEGLHEKETFEDEVVENPSKKQKIVKVKEDKDLFEPSPQESILAVSARLDNQEYKPVILNSSVVSQNSATELDIEVDKILQNSDNRLVLFYLWNHIYKEDCYEEAH